MKLIVFDAKFVGTEWLGTIMVAAETTFQAEQEIKESVHHLQDLESLKVRKSICLDSLPVILSVDPVHSDRFKYNSKFNVNKGR